jgi:uncharacterized protein (DUF1501 family)
MFRVEAERTQRYCDGLSRRSFLQVGVAGMASVGLAGVLRAAQGGVPDAKRSKDTAVILLWLDGGPSHMDLYDMKPEAPAEYRGIWRPIKTNVPGMEITELFPRQAQIADKFSIIRSLHHDDGDHFGAAAKMITSRGGPNGADFTPRFPSIGSVASRMCGPRKSGVPAHVAVPFSMSVGQRPGFFTSTYLGKQYDAFEPGGDPNAEKYAIQNLDLTPGMTLQRLEDRRQLNAHFDKIRRDADASGAMDTMDKFNRSAFDLLVSPAARAAFDISSEEARVREMYGRTSWGQSALLARRLVEAGATFVTVHMGGWDHHWNLQSGMESNLPIIDRAISGLFTDLCQRGLYEKVLVVMCGEFSRTPRMNNGGNGGPPGSMGTPGRDHWGNAMFCLMGGGGVKGGQIVGSTDARGENVKDRPLTPSDVHQTIYHVLGVDPAESFLDHTGRPQPIVDGGEPIRELI